MCLPGWLGTVYLVFIQGHPEYDARALTREYRRDVLRFLLGEQVGYPDLPFHYFDKATEEGLRDLQVKAVTGHDREIIAPVIKALLASAARQLHGD